MVAFILVVNLWFGVRQTSAVFDNGKVRVCQDICAETEELCDKRCSSGKFCSSYVKWCRRFCHENEVYKLDGVIITPDVNTRQASDRRQKTPMNYDIVRALPPGWFDRRHHFAIKPTWRCRCNRPWTDKGVHLSQEV
ncbi:hypothetical protein LSAT2_000206 [Lamellibrachia satsuma]|nr:hypothetical protein LSAT2_000206 [Lamellibrachia satsuma]